MGMVWVTDHGGNVMGGRWNAVAWQRGGRAMECGGVATWWAGDGMRWRGNVMGGRWNAVAWQRGKAGDGMRWRGNVVRAKQARVKILAITQPVFALASPLRHRIGKHDAMTPGIASGTRRHDARHRIGEHDATPTNVDDSTHCTGA
jgi:hypothetical protein